MAGNKITNITCASCGKTFNWPYRLPTLKFCVACSGQETIENTPSKHEDSERSFTQLSRAWYGKVNLNTDSYKNISEEIIIGFYYADGGTTGEFCIEWVNLGDKLAPRLSVFEDSWNALWGFKDLLEKLAELDNTNPTPEKICEILKSCGIKDTTPTENPYKKKELNFNDYLDLACKTFPEHNWNKAQLAPPELLKNVAIELLIHGDNTSQLAQETIKNLEHLQNNGSTLFQ